MAEKDAELWEAHEGKAGKKRPEQAKTDAAMDRVNSSASSAAAPVRATNSAAEIEDADSRTRSLLGEAALARIAAAHVVVIGVGGVGGMAAEALLRSGVGHLLLIDKDRFAVSNLNRQLGALYSTLGQSKAEVLQRRFADIRPQAEVQIREAVYGPGEEGAALLSGDFAKPDVLVDAIDDIPAKMALLRLAAERSFPYIGACGCGRRLDPRQLLLTDLSKTSGDPIARALRKHCRESGLRHVLVVSSQEAARELPAGSPGPSSAIFVPAAAGLLLASAVVQHLSGNREIPVPAY